MINTQESSILLKTVEEYLIYFKTISKELILKIKVFLKS